MLSTEQKRLKQANTTLKDESTVVDNKSVYQIRRALSKYDFDRVAELWANLTMIQQMQGRDHWLSNSKNSGLSWNEYIHRLLRSRGARTIVFENEEMIFGFAYMVLENKNQNNAKSSPMLKAVIKEMYLEPGFREKIDKSEMAEMMRQCLLNMRIDYFEVDVVDLMI